MTAPRDEPIVDPATDPALEPVPYLAPDPWAGTALDIDPVGPARRDEPDEPDDPDDDLFDDSFQAPRRTNRLTVVLLVALLVVAGFAGGVLAQKHHDVALAAAAAGIPRRAGGQGGGGRGGDGSTTAPGAGRGSGGDAAAAGAPVVVGTVRTVDTDSVEVTDASGAVVRVLVPQTATVTTLGLGGLTVDTPVSVAGTKGADGSVEATSVTVRRPGT